MKPALAIAACILLISTLSIPAAPYLPAKVKLDDDVHHVVTWNGKNLIPHTHYRKLRFSLHKASIYSFQMLDPAAVPRQQFETGMGWDMGQVPAPWDHLETIT